MESAARTTRLSVLSAGISRSMWLIPAVVLIFGVVYYSIGYTVFTSLYNWNGISPDRDFAGLDNYAKAASDRYFGISIRNVFIFTPVTILFTLFFGFIFAVLVRSRLRWKGFYKVIIFVPAVISPALTAPIFRRILASGGDLNGILDSIGLSGLFKPVLADVNLALWALMAIAIWHGIGFNFLFYYASLALVDESVLDAARIDGAGNIRIIFRIVAPIVKPTTFALILLGVIGGLRTFEIPFLVTQGGPARATEFPGTLIYKELISKFNAGYAAAISVIVAVAAIIVTIVQLYAGRKAVK